MKLKALWTIIFGLILVGVQAQNWKIQSSNIAFRIKNAGLGVDGTLGGLVANIKFDPTHPENADLDASVDVNTIDTGIALRNKHLKEEYFDAVHFPVIKMKTVKITGQNGNYSAVFKLTIKDVSKEVKIPITFIQTGSTAKFKTNFAINRRDYKVGGYSLIMGDEVNVNMEVVAIQVK